LDYDYVWIVRKGSKKLRRSIKSVDIDADVVLLSCPWCGSTPSVLTEINEFRVACNNASCQVIARTQWKTDMIEVIYDWNKRSMQSKPDDHVLQQ
jgi:hypothetical protein